MILPAVVYLLVGDCSGGRMEAITPTSLSFPTGESSAVQKSKQYSYMHINPCTTMYVYSQTVLLVYDL